MAHLQPQRALVYQQVLQLEVTMAEGLLMHVLQGIQQLSQHLCTKLAQMRGYVVALCSQALIHEQLRSMCAAAMPQILQQWC